MISINFVGDIALFGIFEEKEIDPFKEVKLPRSDYNIGNFEFIVSNNRKAHFYDVSPKYKVSYNFFRSLQLDKFNAFSLANNHCMDYNTGGAEDVIGVLKQKRISSFGFGEKNFNLLTFNIKEVSFAVIAFVKDGRWSRGGEHFKGPDSYLVDDVINEIKHLKNLFNHVLVFPHWGTELVDVPDPNDVINARAFIDAGAIAVIGHHPHIIQGIENYNNGVIAYSLGSFIYVPDNEVGYSKSQGENRNYSICLNLKFDKINLIEQSPVFYKYCKNTHVPKEIDYNEIEGYFKEINSEINKEGLYSSKVRKVLFVREIKSFIHRFKSAPIKTIFHYVNYIKIEHFKKLMK